MTRLLRAGVLLIAGITVVTGFAQMIAPALMLTFVGARADGPAPHLFATIGMFMALFGGSVLQAELGSGPAGPVPLWATLQKVGAAALVAVGVARGVFGAIALAVAAFDALSAVWMAAYFLQKRR
jgi:hypothetical protein